MILNEIRMMLKRTINKLFPVEFSNQHIIQLSIINEKNILQDMVGQCFTRANFAYSFYRPMTFYVKVVICY